MTGNTRQKLADSFSEGTFQLSLTRLDSIYVTAGFQTFDRVLKRSTGL